MFVKAEERDAFARTAWVKRAEEANAFEETRPGKRVGLLDLQVERAWKKQQRSFRLIVEVTERTLDKRGQHLPVPDIQIEGWWRGLTLPATEVIEHYRYHGTHEKFHAEIKSDLDLERLPPRKFDTNDCVLHLGAFAYNCLRLLGQWGLTRDCAHPASGQAQKAQDGVAGDHVPGGEVRGPCQKTHSRLWSRICRACSGVRRASGSMP